MTDGVGTAVITPVVNRTRWLHSVIQHKHKGRNAMGGFYSSIHVRCNQAESVHDELTSWSNPLVVCLIGRSKSGWVPVYPESDRADQIAEILSREMQTAVLHVYIHDSDVFNYSFYKNGIEIDTFCSCPDYFNDGPTDVASIQKQLKKLGESMPDADVEKLQKMFENLERTVQSFGGELGEGEEIDPESTRGNPEVFEEYLASPGDVETLRGLLETMRTTLLSQTDADERFCDVLQLSEAMTAYSYLKSEGVDQKDGFFHLKPKKQKQGADRREISKQNMVRLVRQFESDPQHGPVVALIEAVKHELPDEVERLLDAGTDVNARDPDGPTALICATHNKTLKIMKLLIKRGADPNRCDNKGTTPLHSLLSGMIWDKDKIEKRINLLIDAGADPSLKDNNGKTPVDWANERRFYDVAKILTER